MAGGVSCVILMASVEHGGGRSSPHLTARRRGPITLPAGGGKDEEICRESRARWNDVELVYDSNVTASSVTNGLIKRSPSGPLTFSHYANNMMNQSPKPLAPSGLRITQNKYLE